MATLHLMSVFIVFGLFNVASTGKGKRILLNDPNYLQQELHQIQVKLQEYEATKNQVVGLLSKVSSQEHGMSILQSKLAAVEMEVSALQQTLNATKKSEAALQAELAARNSQVAALQANVSNQQHKLASLQSKIMTQELNMSSIRSELWVEKSDIISLQAVVTANASDISMKLAAQEAKITNLKSQIQNEQGGNKGTVYIRWGRKDCPTDNGTHLVYTGYAGGSNSAHTGGAAEMVCLPSDPTWGPHKNIEHYNPAHMYGAEYEDALLFNMPNQDEDVPCAFCRSSFHSTSIMIPGREQCYPDWVEAYHGVLSAGSTGSPSPTQYTCVDEHPQALTGGGITNSEGRLLYQVRTVCGSLQCPPYEDDKVLSCVVCLK